MGIFIYKIRPKFSELSLYSCRIMCSGGSFDVWWGDVLHFLLACQKGPLPAENIKGSSVEINVYELSLLSEITLKL